MHILHRGVECWMAQDGHVREIRFNYTWDRSREIPPCSVHQKHEHIFEIGDLECVLY